MKRAFELARQFPHYSLTISFTPVNPTLGGSKPIDAPLQVEELYFDFPWYRLFSLMVDAGAAVEHRGGIGLPTMAKHFRISS